MKPAYATVPRLWAGETVVCVASGPSLTQADVDLCRDRAKVIVVNDGYRMAPWAEALYACDFQWWRVHQGVPSFAGLKFSIHPKAARFGVQVLRNTGPDGLETDPSGLRTGSNSGYQAINLAVHLGAARILLLGYDMQRTGGKSHWFGDHPYGLQSRPALSLFVRHFATLVPPLRALGIPVINCTRETALTCFPRHPLEDALAVAVAA